MSDSPQFRLLLVEDEPTQRKLVERQLRRAGYAVETANDGTEALAKILDGQFQLLLTDWDMPGMDGRTLCRRVREANLPSYLYILLLTSHGTTDDVVAGLDAGADDYVRKPANEAELLARLNSGRRIVQLEQSLREANAKIQQLSETDPLVGTFNRRYLSAQLVREVDRARRYKHPLSAVMADLDRFKRINDERGHQTGDEVLQHFASIAKSALRPSDWMARYGGEEFVIVLPETDLAGAVTVAEKLRSLCANAPFPTSSGEIAVTASFGVAELGIEADERSEDTIAQALLRRADAGLYTSKNEGRNRVTATSS
jgi:two-component system, cell cycle response regulator